MTMFETELLEERRDLIEIIQGMIDEGDDEIEMKRLRRRVWAIDERLDDFRRTLRRARARCGGER